MSDTVSSSTDYQRKKSKHAKKHKKESKSKRNKHKKQKHSRKVDFDELDNESRRESINDATPKISVVENDSTNSDNAFGPVLPPHLKIKENRKTIVGPTLPPGIILDSPENSKHVSSDNDDEVFGPMPSDVSLENKTTAQIALEKRALETKLAKFDDLTGASTSNQNIREEWMLELPEIGANKDILGTLKRTFKKKEGPDFSDRSSWTTTPNDSKNPKDQLSKTKKNLKNFTEDRSERQRDAEQEKIAKKVHKKQKRDESLVTIHKRKMKEKAEELKSAQQRRPFSRDVDLKLDKIDKNQTQKIVNKAKFLDSRFSGGKTKYL